MEEWTRSCIIFLTTPLCDTTRRQPRWESCMMRQPGLPNHHLMTACMQALSSTKGSLTSCYDFEPTGYPSQQTSRKLFWWFQSQRKTGMCWDSFGLTTCLRMNQRPQSWGLPMLCSEYHQVRFCSTSQSSITSKKVHGNPSKDCHGHNELDLCRQYIVFGAEDEKSAYNLYLESKILKEGSFNLWEFTACSPSLQDKINPAEGVEDTSQPESTSLIYAICTVAWVTAYFFWLLFKKK